MQSVSYRVLVIDDDYNMLTLLRLLLEGRGHQALLASDGEVGLQVAAVEQPSLILLDLALPQRSGFDIYVDLQHNPCTADIPILILSAATRQDLGTWRALPSVADVYTKPFDVARLIARIEEICDERARQLGH